MKATPDGGILGLPSMKSLTLVGPKVFHFENGKIKEAWTIYDGLKPALGLGLVEIVQLQDSNKGTFITSFSHQAF